jgi:hypothetical protein
MKAGLQITKQDGKPFDFGPSYIIWAIQAVNVVQEAYLGNGAEINPFRLNSIGQWAKAAATQTVKGFDLYAIGGQIIERNPAGQYADYMTDVVEAVPVVGYKDVSTAGRPRSFPSPDRRDTTPIYRKKYERIVASVDTLDNVKVAKQMRELLKGTQKMNIVYSAELPGTVASMFLAEVYRAPVMLPIGLMLLDLIEKQVVYGREDKKTYTIEKMMSDLNNPGDRISGGKHPMLHDNTINQADQMFQALNPVTRKAVSITTAWLTYYLRNELQWKVSPIREVSDYSVKGSLPKLIKTFNQNLQTDESSNRNGFYLAKVQPALQKRSSTLDCLLV